MKASKRLIVLGMACALPAAALAEDAPGSAAPTAQEFKAPAKAGPADDMPPPAFQSVARAQIRYLSGGAFSISQGAFIFLPESFNVAYLVEAIRDDSDWDVTGEVKLARPFAPSTPWGRTFGGVARLQVADMYAPVLAGGIQWNITDTPGIDALVDRKVVKSIFQAFVKTNAEYAGDEAGLIDYYHWYQFPLWEKVYVRGVNTYFEVKGGEDSYALMQDLIRPVAERVEVYLHHTYRNTEFGGEPDGSRWGLGVRVALW